MKYLLDTNICIYYVKGKFNLKEKFRAVDTGALFISEITLAELKFGIANSQSPSKNAESLDKFLTGVQILPIFDSLDVYANEKARLRKSGKPVDDFDLLIGASAIANNLTLITNNIRHFKRLKGIKLENWIV